MYTSILVPLDGSRLSEQALPVAALLAERSGAALRLALVHVPFVTGYATGAPIVDPTLDAQSRAVDQAYIEVVQKRVADDVAQRVTAVILDGPVAESLAQHVTVTSTDLVVMTTNGRTGLSRTWLGSVTDALIRRGTVPMLVVRPRENLPDQRHPSTVQKILISLDGSVFAEHVIEAALTLGTVTKTTFILVQVVDRLRPTGYAAVARGIDMEQEIVRREQDEAVNYLGSVANRIRSMGHEVQTTIIVERQPAHAILDYARHEGLDLIALSTRGRGGLSRMLLGSVADEVLRNADIPVLIQRIGDDGAQS